MKKVTPAPETEDCPYCNTFTELVFCRISPGEFTVSCPVCDFFVKGHGMHWSKMARVWNEEVRSLKKPAPGGEAAE